MTITRKKKLFWAVPVMIFVVIQWFGPARTNPPVVPSHMIQSQLQIPPPVANIMNRACIDCHSDETRWPWYSRVAPVRWWLVNHVNKGRNELNYSRWTQYQPSYAAATLGAMGNVVKKGLMPLACYIPLHPQARLSNDEIKVFYEWTQTERQRLLNTLRDNGKMEKPIIR